MVGTRTTRGKFVGSGETFELVGNYSVAADAHKIMANAWVGTTTLIEAVGDKAPAALLHRQSKELQENMRLRIPITNLVGWRKGDGGGEIESG